MGRQPSIRGVPSGPVLLRRPEAAREGAEGQGQGAGGLRSGALGRGHLQEEDRGRSNRGENKEDLGAALEKAFRQMGGKPEMLYSDAEPGPTSNQTQSWLKRQKNIAHNITLRHAPVAERMMRYIRNQIVHAIRGTNKVVGSSRRRRAGLQREPRKPQHADDAKGRGEEREPSASKDGSGEHQKERQPATSTRARGQGQGHRQAEVRGRIHAGLERRGLYRRQRIKRARPSPSHAHIVPT